MDELFISICGVRAKVRAHTHEMRAIVEQLAFDFKELAVEGAGESQITLDLVEKTPLETEGRRLPRFVFRVAIADVYGWWGGRVCRYFDDVLAESKFVGGSRKFWISGRDPDLLHEAAYTILLSALGEELDLRGLHRIHALGVECGGMRALVLAPSGGGKSAMAGLLLRDSLRTKLYSDESPLLLMNKIISFPLRLALQPNVARALDFGDGKLFKRRKFAPKLRLPFPPAAKAEPGPINALMVGVRTKGFAKITQKNRLSALPAVFMSLVVGVGLAQMSEWMLRMDNIPRLVRIAYKRSVTMLHLLFRADAIYEFQLGADARDNAECLSAFFRAREQSFSIFETIPHRENHPGL